MINLYNKNNTENKPAKTLNFSVSPPTLINSAEAETSHPIKVVAGGVYTMLFNTAYFGALHSRTALYDKDGIFIDRVTPVIVDGIGTIKIPTFYPQADHILFSYRRVDKEQMMVVEGESYPTGYIPFDNVTEGRKFVTNPLYQQRMETAGDSIMWGAGDYGRGWPYRIALNNQMTYNNRAVSGAVFARGVKTSSGADVPTILDQIGQVTGNAMFNLVEGGTNDEDYNVPMGTITSGKNGPFDETTYSGALESAFSQLIAKCHGKKIIYIIPQKMGNTTWQARRYTRFVRAMEICKKWGIPYVNLWDECYLDPTVPAVQNAYYSDEQHLNSNGYDLTTPIIENKLLMI